MSRDNVKKTCGNCQASIVAMVSKTMGNKYGCDNPNSEHFGKLVSLNSTCEEWARIKIKEKAL